MHSSILAKDDAGPNAKRSAGRTRTQQGMYPRVMTLTSNYRRTVTTVIVHVVTIRHNLNGSAVIEEAVSRTPLKSIQAAARLRGRSCTLSTFLLSTRGCTALLTRGLLASSTPRGKSCKRRFQKLKTAGSCSACRTINSCSMASRSKPGKQSAVSRSC